MKEGIPSYLHEKDKTQEREQKYLIWEIRQDLQIHVLRWASEVIQKNKTEKKEGKNTIFQSKCQNMWRNCHQRFVHMNHHVQIQSIGADLFVQCTFGSVWHSLKTTAFFMSNIWQSVWHQILFSCKMLPFLLPVELCRPANICSFVLIVHYVLIDFAA